MKIFDERPVISNASYQYFLHDAKVQACYEAQSFYNDTSPVSPMPDYLPLYPSFYQITANMLFKVYTIEMDSK